MWSRQRSGTGRRAASFARASRAECTRRAASHGSTPRMKAIPSAACAAPPAPRISMRRAPFQAPNSSSARSKAGASVLWPIRRMPCAVSSRVIVLTAPAMRRALSSRSSSNGMTASFHGIVTLAPSILARAGPPLARAAPPHLARPIARSALRRRVRRTRPAAWRENASGRWDGRSVQRA